MKLINTVAIVDGASTSAYLVPAFRSYGIKCVHVLSSESLPDRLKVQIIHTDYIRSVVYQGDISVLANMLKDLQIDVVYQAGGVALSLPPNLLMHLTSPIKTPGIWQKPAVINMNRLKYCTVAVYSRQNSISQIRLLGSWNGHALI